MLGSGYSVLGSGYSPHGRVSGASEAAWREEMGACLLRAQPGDLLPSVSTANTAARAHFLAEVLSSHRSLASSSFLRKKVTGSSLFSPAQMRYLGRSGE